MPQPARSSTRRSPSSVAGRDEHLGQRGVGVAQPRLGPGPPAGGPRRAARRSTRRRHRAAGRGPTRGRGSTRQHLGGAERGERHGPRATASRSSAPARERGRAPRSACAGGRATAVPSPQRARPHQSLDAGLVGPAPVAARGCGTVRRVPGRRSDEAQVASWPARRPAADGLRLAGGDDAGRGRRRRRSSRARCAARCRSACSKRPIVVAEPERGGSNGRRRERGHARHPAAGARRRARSAASSRYCCGDRRPEQLGRDPAAPRPTCAAASRAR